MRPTSVSAIGATILGTGVLGFVVLRAWMSGGGGPLPVTLASLFLLGAISVVVLVAAWPVRRWNAGVRTKAFDPLRAARAAVLAKATAYSGAVLAGWYLGQVLVLVGDWGVQPLRNALWRCLAAGVLALVTIGAGLLAESWCRVRKDDDDDERDAPVGDSEPGLA